MTRTLVNILAIGAIGYVGLCAALYLFQRSLIYFPRPAPDAVAGSRMSLQSGGETVMVTVRPAGGPDALIYFGGNAEEVSGNLPSFSAAFPDHAIYLLHYRGYGGSSGSPSEEGIFGDALALFDLARAEHPRIVLIGRSLGSGVAVRLASVRPAARLVLVTAYESLQEVAAGIYPFFPVRWLLKDKYESWRYAAKVTAPTLVIAAEHDEVIPRESTERLMTHFAPGVASFRVLPGTGHNTIGNSPAYLPLLRGAQ